MDGTKRIALLIDADNASVATLDYVLGEIADLGVANVRRAYGDWGSSHLSGWRDALLGNAIQPVQQVAYTKKGNASDMAMVVEAMDLLYSGKIDAFALMTSDTDFTPLAMRLRAASMGVYGFGKVQTPNPFKVACSVFFHVDEHDMSRAVTEPVIDAAVVNPGNSSAVVTVVPLQLPQPPTIRLVQPPIRKTGAELRGDTNLVNLLRNAVQAARSDDGWSHLGGVGSYVVNRGSFTPKNYGYGALKSLIVATGLFEVGRWKQRANEAQVAEESHDCPCRKASVKRLKLRPVRQGGRRSLARSPVNGAG